MSCQTVSQLRQRQFMIGQLFICYRLVTPELIVLTRLMSYPFILGCCKFPTTICSLNWRIFLLFFLSLWPNICSPLPNLCFLLPNLTQSLVKKRTKVWQFREQIFSRNLLQPEGLSHESFRCLEIMLSGKFQLSLAIHECLTAEMLHLGELCYSGTGWIKNITFGMRDDCPGYQTMKVQQMQCIVKTTKNPSFCIPK